MAKIGQHAVVIGASISGLLAARTLSDLYDRVSIVERDALVDACVPRKGAPQGRHAHGLLAKGSQTLEALFPGFIDDVRAEGGLVDDIGGRCTWSNFNSVLCSDPIDLTGILLSRPALETLVRRRVARLENVRILPSTDAVEPKIDAASVRVTGLVTRPTGQSDGEISIEADLVVDAGGRGARSPTWLDRLGYPKPSEETVRVDLGYMTRRYRRRPDHLPGRHAAVLAPCAPAWRSGVILAQEGDTWITSIGGYFGDHAPEDDAGYIAFARSLPLPDIYDVIKDADPLDAPNAYYFPASLRRRYEKLARFPEGFLVFGDALCSLNPVYGQGMSVAAAQALALREAIAKGADGVAKRFFFAASRVIDAPWQMAVGADFAHPKVAGLRPASTRFINWYVEKLFQAGGADPFVAKRFIEVANLMRPPADLMSPGVAWRVWRAHSTAKLKPSSTAQARPG